MRRFFYALVVFISIALVGCIDTRSVSTVECDPDIYCDVDDTPVCGLEDGKDYACAEVAECEDVAYSEDSYFCDRVECPTVELDCEAECPGDFSLSADDYGCPACHCNPCDADTYCDNPVDFPVCGVDGEIYFCAAQAACEGVEISKDRELCYDDHFACPAMELDCEADCPGDFSVGVGVDGCETCDCK